ncbi:GxxExxY protein [Rhodopirellula bahusiensis]|uniref:GxxExxY protein n=1 Tax=Rhodopirellula bahusiensis TaxID=2014065 RepID=UPI001E47563D|nr:GxxExxY protein [Rhodopirellula bahusiensis]
MNNMDRLSGILEAQLLTDMKLSKLKTGLLITFNVAKLMDGLKRFVLRLFRLRALRVLRGTTFPRPTNTV